MPNAAPTPFALKARYVFPIAGDPIPDGVVTIEGARIAAVGSRTAVGAPLEDLGSVALLPGLVNAHTHLDWSCLERPIGRPGMGFVDWIRAVMRQRLEVPPQQPVGWGLDESVRRGTTMLGDIAQPGRPLSPYANAPLDTTVFLELVGLQSERIASALEAARAHLEAGAGGGCGSVVPGLSPHAPYSVHPRLLDALVSLARGAHVPFAMHLAESREELDLLASGSGPFRELLEDMGLWTPGLIPLRTRPGDYLARLARAERALIIHGNYLDDAEIAFLGQHADRMSVVYCPRTHAYFGHDPYPLGQMLSAGATVALGTDSRASSPDLGLLAEMRTVAHQHPEVPRAAILRLGTVCGAKALGRQQDLGTLEPGKLADLTAVALPPGSTSDPCELLLEGPGDVVGRWYRGSR